MIHRREFCTTVGVAGSGLFLPRPFAPRQAIEVRAAATVFHSHDNRVLVRFSVTGSDAPAGRLRVYDSNRGLIGTAGVLAVAGRLYGEFWIPIDGPTRILTDLELPRRTPLRSEHSLEPPRKWIIHWETAVSAATLEDRLEALAPAERAGEIARLREQRLVVNPTPTAANDLDLQSLIDALRRPLNLARDLGMDLGTVAHADSADISPTLPVLMRAAGVRHAITNGRDPIQWLESPGGIRILGVGVGSLGNAASLGFAGGPASMAPLIERFIERRYADSNSDHLMIASSGLSADRPALLAAVEEWNGRYAFPRVEFSADVFPDEGVAGTIPVHPLPPRETAVPDAARLRELAPPRVAVAAAGIDRLIAAATQALGLPPGGIGSAFSLPAPGYLVVNGSPYTRSDVAPLPDGGEFVATNIPPTGYAYFPGSPRTHTTNTDSLLTASNGSLGLSIDGATGAISSLTDGNGIEWVAERAGGWNSLPRCRLDAVGRETIPGLGTRFRLDRWSTARGALTTVVTLYDALPWIDVSNDCEGVGLSALEYGFPVAIPRPLVSWDLTADRVEARAPVGRMVHDRFVALAGSDRTLLFRCYESPHFSVGADGHLIGYGPRGVCRFRLAVISDGRFDDDPQSFGWSGDPFTVLEAPGTGSLVSATFGSFLSTDRRGVTIVGVRTSDQPGELVVYLQNQGSFAGSVRVRGGLLGFAASRQCDLLERDIGELVPGGPDGAPVTVEPRGLAAVRLIDVSQASP